MNEYLRESIARFGAMMERTSSWTGEFIPWQMWINCSDAKELDAFMSL